MAKLSFKQEERNNQELPSVKITKMQIMRSRRDKIYLGISISLNIILMVYVILTTIK